MYLRPRHALCYVQSFECCPCLDNQLERNSKLISNCKYKYDICKLSFLAYGDIRFTYAAIQEVQNHFGFLSIKQNFQRFRKKIQVKNLFI